MTPAGLVFITTKRETLDATKSEHLQDPTNCKPIWMQTFLMIPQVLREPEHKSLHNGIFGIIFADINFHRVTHIDGGRLTLCFVCCSVEL